MARPRYRWRRRIRPHLPWFLINMGVAAKGRKDCGAHVFYNHDYVVEHCYYCEAGERPYDPAHFEAKDADRPV